jgi:bifunctional DNA-binding transcriptional regulator/antitoxin component of YhaV-PrlF toxin-antitoxin module
MSTEQKPARGGSDDRIVETVTAQNRNGSIQITIPKAAVDRFGIEKGDGLLVTAGKSAEELTVRPSATLFDE